jgi:hypothetical protein
MTERIKALLPLLVLALLGLALLLYALTGVQ